MAEIIQRTAPAISRETPAEQLNRITPAYTRESIHRFRTGMQAVPQPAPVQSRPAPAKPVTPGPVTIPSPVPPAAPGPVIPRPAPVSSPVPPRPLTVPPVPVPVPDAPAVSRMVPPALQHPVSRGQKTPLGMPLSATDRLLVCFGWNVTDGRCDPDASAFLLGENGKVPGDDWFVFYGHESSPDGSVTFSNRCRDDREQLSLDLSKLKADIQKIVFVLTINDALEKDLHFGMVRDAYVRVLRAADRQELVSFRVDDASAQVTSMTLCEIYPHGGQWRFNPVGSGVHQDLAGQCGVYGVDIG